MKVKELVSFRKETFFNGAVQTDWFYDPDKAKTIAESYVFHGPKYYGVSTEDVNAGEHRLMDTASFSKTIADKLYSHSPGNCFVMTIAKYGTGKSHLAVCLGTMFSGDAAAANAVANNISAADSDIGEYIRQVNTKRNLVIVLNGMNNFNLDSEVLRCARLSLAQHGIDDDLLKKLTKSYDVARHFVDRTFEIYQKQFEYEANQSGLPLNGAALKKHLISCVENSSQSLSIINKIYKEVNGDSIAWDRGLSAGDILLVLQEELCGAGKPFNKVLLLFDEFGRYIEYTAANPAIAGEASLQQIFESIQSANGDIVFVGFIQSELEAYLARIDKTSNILRYLERYRSASENLFLSSNFETVLANILKKSNPDFSRVVGGSLGKYKNYYLKIKASLTRWDTAASKKSVWSSDDLYKNVILNGCYPLHPITVWLLARSDAWMQQRSTLAFAAEIYETIAQSKIQNGFLPYVYPYQIVDSGIFGEMLNAEEKGLVLSQYCMLYRDILVKVGDKLTELEHTILKSVLVVNRGRMAFFDKNDAIGAIQLCSNCKEDEVRHALKSLEEMHGVIAFDDHARKFDLIAEANGFNEFKRIFAKYRLGVTSSIDDVDETVSKLIALDTPVETSFAQEHHISSTEWMFAKRLMDCSDIRESFLRTALRNICENCDGEKARGLLIYAYCSDNISTEVVRLSKLYRDLNLKNYPVIILFLDDNEKEILAALTVKKALQKFSVADKERFHKHLSDQLRVQNNKFCRKFTSCVSKRNMIGDAGLLSYTVRINALCSKRFEELYSKAVPFVFDGFESKSKIQANATLTTICCYLYNRLLMNPQGYNALSAKDKNRVNSVLSLTAPHAWKVFDKNCRLVESGSPVISEIVADIIHTLEDGERHCVYQLFYKFVQAPYGMNDNSISLLVSYFIAYQENRYIYYYGAERLTPKHWSTDKGKLKIPELRKIFIQKNANMGVDLIAELCEKIMANTDVTHCPRLKQELEALVIQEGETEANQYKIGQANTYLDEGIRLSKIVNGQYAKARAHVDALTKKFTILSFVKVFDLMPLITDTIEDGLPYALNDEQRNAVLQLQLDTQHMLTQQYLPALKRIRFQFEELSEYKKKYGRVVDILRANCCDTYADATEQHINAIETALRAKQKYENSLIDCERDITQSKHVSKFNDCSEMLLRLESWSVFFQNARDLPTEIVAPLIERVEYAAIEVRKKRLALQNEYAETIAAAETAGTVMQLRQISAKLSSLMQMQLDYSCQNMILQVQADIESAIGLIENLPRDLDSLSDYVKTAGYKASNNRCWKAIKKGADDLLEDLEKKQDVWVRRCIDEAEKSYQAMSALECQNWLEMTTPVPSYFQSAIVERFNKIRMLVEAQLHHSRVEGLLAAYDELSVSEKETFKALLAKR